MIMSTTVIMTVAVGGGPVPVKGIVNDMGRKVPVAPCFPSRPNLPYYGNSKGMNSYGRRSRTTVSPWLELDVKTWLA